MGNGFPTDQSFQNSGYSLGNLALLFYGILWAYFLIQRIILFAIVTQMKVILVALIAFALFGVALGKPFFFLVVILISGLCVGTGVNCKDNDTAIGECCIWCGVDAINGTCNYQFGLQNPQIYTVCPTVPTALNLGCPVGTRNFHCFCNKKA
jgi:hypothetical protein